MTTAHHAYAQLFEAYDSSIKALEKACASEDDKTQLKALEARILKIQWEFAGVVEKCFRDRALGNSIH